MFYIILLIVCVLIGFGIAYAGRGAHCIALGDIVLIELMANWKIIVAVLIVSALITFAL